MYKVLAESVTGLGGNRFTKGTEVPAYRLKADHIQELIANKLIEEVKAPAPEVKPEKKA